jgi:type IV secretory pathway TraG/TraD family ATPase VirD4
MTQLINLLFGAVISITGAIFSGFISLVEALLTPERTPGYSAKFVSAGTLLSGFNRGFSIGSRALPVHTSYSNLACFGQSGSGKSSSVTIPSVFSLARGGASMVVNAPSGDAYNYCSGYLKRQHYNIFRFDLSSSESCAFNPLARCRTISDLQKLMHLLLKNTLESKAADPFWTQSTIMLLTAFARYLLFYAAPEYRTMYNLSRLVDAFAISPEKTDRLIVATGDQELINSYKGLVVMGERTLASVIATSRTALSIFTDPAIARATSFDCLDIARLRKERIAIFLCNPVTQADYLKPITAILIQTILNECMGKLPDKTDNSVFLCLDEAGSIYFQSLSVIASNIRKYRCSLALLLQDYQSLVALYGPAEAHNIRTNCYTQIYLPGQPLETCKELEQILGRYSFQDGSSERSRQLMTADEIRISKEAIVLCGNHEPIKMRVKPFYKSFLFSRYAACPPPAAANHHFDAIPALPIP